MSEVEDFFKVDSSAPSLTGTTTDNWDFDDFSFDDASLEVPVQAGSSIGNKKVGQVTGGKASGPGPAQEVKVVPGTSNGWVSGEKVGFGPSLEKMSGLDMKDERGGEADEKADELGFSELGNDVDGWEEDDDFFENLGNSGCLDLGNGSPELPSQSPSVSQNTANSVAYAHGLETKGTPDTVMGSLGQQNNLPSSGKIVSDGFGSPKENILGFGMDAQHTSGMGPFGTLRRDSPSQVVDSVVAKGGKIDTADLLNGNVSVDETSAQQPSQPGDGHVNDSSLDWFNSDLVMPAEQNPSHVAGAFGQEPTRGAGLDGVGVHSASQIGQTSSPTQLGTVDVGQSSETQQNLDHAPLEYSSAHGTGDSLWPNGAAEFAGGYLHQEANLETTNHQVQHSGNDRGAELQENPMLSTSISGRNPPHGLEGESASEQWASSNLGQQSNPGMLPEAIQASGPSSSAQAPSPNLESNEAMLTSAIGASAPVPASGWNENSWAHQGLSTGGMEQASQNQLGAEQSGNAWYPGSTTGALGAASTHPYHPHAANTFTQAGLSACGDQQTATYWSQASASRAEPGNGSLSAGYNPPLASHGAGQTDDVAFFDQLDGGGNGGEPVSAVGGSLASAPGENLSHTAPVASLPENQGVNYSTTAAAFPPHTEFRAQNYAYEHGNPPEYRDFQHGNQQASGYEHLSFPQSPSPQNASAQPFEVVDDVSFFDTLGGEGEGATMTGQPAGGHGQTQSPRVEAEEFIDTPHSTGGFQEQNLTQNVARVEDGPAYMTSMNGSQSPEWDNGVGSSQQHAFHPIPEHQQDPSMLGYDRGNGYMANAGVSAGGGFGFANSGASPLHNSIQPASAGLYQPSSVGNGYSAQTAWATKEESVPNGGLGVYGSHLQSPSPAVQPSFSYEPQQQWGGGTGSYGDYTQPASASMSTAPTVPVACEPAAVEQNPTGSWPRVLHGRPACPLVSFGIGGKVAIMIPKVSAMGVSLGQIELHSLRNLPSILSHRQREAGYDIPPGILDPVRAAIEHFPGPLGASTGRDKLASFISERMELCTEEEPECPDHDGLRALWGSLGVMVKHSGFIVDKKAKVNPVASQEFLDVIASSDASDKSWVGGGGGAPIIKEAENGFQIQAAAAEVQKLASLGNVLGAIEVAKSNGLWDIALVLSHNMGSKVFLETASAMTAQKLAPGAPLRTILNIFSGNVEGALEGSPQKVPTAPGSGPQIGMNTAGYTLMTPSSDPVLDEWRGNLAMLATNKTTVSRDVASKLGDRLLSERNDVNAAHMCYLVGGCTPQCIDASSGYRFSLVGWNDKNSVCPSAAAIQRTEIFEWVYGAANPSTRIVAVQPYKLLYAWMLADYGKVSEAAHYCELVLETLKALGSKMPRGLAVCAASAGELLDRLQRHAEAHNIPLKRSATFLESFGRILDKGINRLIGVGEGQPGDDAHSRSHSEARTPSEAISTCKRTTSQASFDSMRNTNEDARQRLSPRPPVAPHSPSSHISGYNQAQSARWPTPTSPSPVASDPYLRHSSSAAALSSYSESALPHQPQHSSLSQSSPHLPPTSTSGSKGGWLSMLWGGSGNAKDAKPHKAPSNGKVSNLAEASQPYYSKELKKWILPGDEGNTDPSTPTPPPPPPTSLNWGKERSNSPGSGSTGPFSFGNNSLSSRYVDTFGGNNAASPVPGGIPGIPAIPAIQKSNCPTPSNFFVPTMPGTQASNGAEFEDVPLE